MNGEDVVFEYGGTESDACIHGVVGSKVADAAAIDAAFVMFEEVDNFHGTNFWGSGNGSGGKACHEGMKGIGVFGYFSLDIGNDVHDMAIVFDDHGFGDTNGTRKCHASDVIASEIEEHEMFSPFFGVIKEIASEFEVFMSIGPAFSCAGDGTNGHGVVTQANENFRAGTDDGGISELEVEEEGRGIDAS